MSFTTTSAFIGTLSAFFLAAVSAQTPASTPVIGFYKQAFDLGGAYSITNGFVTKTEFQGQATATPIVSGAQMTISQTGAGWTNNSFNTFPVGSSSHYVEVLDDGNALHTGLILDILGNATSSITAAVPIGFAPGPNFKYSVRKHSTLGTILPLGCGLLEETDTAILFDAVGNELDAIFATGGIWRNVIDLSDLSNKVLYPGEGLVLVVADPRTITMGGGSVSYVKSGPTRVSLPATVPTLIGLINPLVATSPVDPIYNTTARNTLIEAGFNLIAPDSDFIIQLKQDGNLADDKDIILSGSTGQLINQLNNANVGNALIRNGESVLFIPAADISYVIPQRH